MSAMRTGKSHLNRLYIRSLREDWKVPLKGGSHIVAETTFPLLTIALSIR
jgi:hypothetical protein